MLTEFGSIISALFSNDAFMIRTAFGTQGMWLFGFLLTLVGAVVVLAIYRFVPLIDRHLEKTVMVWTYLLIAAIIFVEVIRRFIFNLQAPWSTTLPPFLFLIMTWFGCSYNVRLRTHLAFAEFRNAMPRTGQMALLWLDALLWLGFCWVVVVSSLRIVANSASNFQILLGTDNVQQWWFLATVPLAFILLAARVLENLIEDVQNYRAGKPLIEQAVIGAD